MSKPIKSTDPRKKSIVANLKEKSGGTKVTNVKQTGESQFQGDCLKLRKLPYVTGSDICLSKWEHLGTFTTEL